MSKTNKIKATVEITLRGRYKTSDDAAEVYKKLLRETDDFVVESIYQQFETSEAEPELIYKKIEQENKVNEIKFKELHIFGIQAGKDGQNTLEFCDGAILGVPDERLIFEYKSKSTGEVRKAMFFKANISGFSYT